MKKPLRLSLAALLTIGVATGSMAAPGDGPGASTNQQTVGAQTGSQQQSTSATPSVPATHMPTTGVPMTTPGQPGSPPSNGGGMGGGQGTGGSGTGSR